MGKRIIKSLGESTGKYVVIGDETLASGQNDHKWLMMKMVGTRFGNPEIEDARKVGERIVREVGANRVDMGFLGREGTEIEMFGDSATFGLPEIRALPEAKEHARRVLQKKYGGEKFVTRT